MAANQSLEMQQLTADVAAENTVIGSAITAFNGLAVQIAAAAGDKQQSLALAALVNTQAAALAAAIPANTPIQPIPPTPIGSTFPNLVAFNDAVAVYTGGSEVDLDGAVVKAGTSPALLFTTGAGGVITQTTPVVTPPVVTPLATSFPSVAAFTAAAAAYTGPEAVTLDGAAVTTAGPTPAVGALAYFSHSTSTPPGAVDMTGPTS